MMRHFARAVIIGVLVALGGVGACGGTGSVSIPGQVCTVNIFFGGGVIPPHPDGPSACAQGPCNYQTQTGCKDGETCWPDIDESRGTVTPACGVPGARTHGQTCDNVDLCGPGLYCVEGACRKMCCGADWSACPSGESCIHQVDARIDDAGATVPAGFDLCFPVNDCDVLDPGACSEQHQVCRIADPLGDVACEQPSSLELGAPCDSPAQCDKGLICAGAAAPAQGTCRKLCRWAACGSPACGGSEGDCVHFNRDPVGVGECTPNWHGPAVVSDGGLLYEPDGAVVTSLDAGHD